VYFKPPSGGFYLPMSHSKNGQIRVAGMLDLASKTNEGSGEVTLDIIKHP
jgi:hypothetical protein